MFYLVLNCILLQRNVFGWFVDAFLHIYSVDVGVNVWEIMLVCMHVNRIVNCKVHWTYAGYCTKNRSSSSASSLFFIFFVQVWLRTEVLSTRSLTQPGFALMTSRSWQCISCHRWDSCCNNLVISASFSWLLFFLKQYFIRSAEFMCSMTAILSLASPFLHNRLRSLSGAWCEHQWLHWYCHIWGLYGPRLWQFCVQHTLYVDSAGSRWTGKWT